LEQDELWDVLVIGGGITGAGILREATRAGVRVLLVEARDFGWGTSSRSSKLVHGGLRYLRNFQIGLTRASVQERERLLEEGPGLIDPLGFLLATYEGDRPGGWVYEAGLTVYDLLALRWSHRQYDAHDFQLLAPHITTAGLQGGFRYGDAQTDDARLVLRVIQEAVRDGGVVLNYARAETLLRDGQGQVNGVLLRDRGDGPDRTVPVHARVVISATGAWADALREQLGASPRIRPLRGSHLIFPRRKLPVAQAISFLHPWDRRPVFIFPWEGITLVGTTDVDHAQPLDQEPHISGEEYAYLLAAVRTQFASLDLDAADVRSTFAGVRPVVGTGQVDPSKESRDHVLWEEEGLLTVTGGKLTTFRLIALDALQVAQKQLPDLQKPDKKQPVLDPVDVDLPGASHLDQARRQRLLGRYGAAAPALVAAAEAGELEPVPDTDILWAELRWAARAEGVVHLDDLLLRRVRLGLLTDEGGWPIIERVRAIVQPELGWDDRRWEEEAEGYAALWQRSYSRPEGGPEGIADMASALIAPDAETVSRPAPADRKFRPARSPRWWVAPLLLALLLLGWLLGKGWRERKP
jgi:glycerol-3-phosphate dehydrogenase